MLFKRLILVVAFLFSLCSGSALAEGGHCPKCGKNYNYGQFCATDGELLLSHAPTSDDIMIEGVPFPKDGIHFKYLETSTSRIRLMVEDGKLTGKRIFPKGLNISGVVPKVLSPVIIKENDVLYDKNKGVWLYPPKEWEAISSKGFQAPKVIDVLGAYKSEIEGTSNVYLGILRLYNTDNLPSPKEFAHQLFLKQSENSLLNKITVFRKTMVQGIECVEAHSISDYKRYSNLSKENSFNEFRFLVYPEKPYRQTFLLVIAHTDQNNSKRLENVWSDLKKGMSFSLSGIEGMIKGADDIFPEKWVMNLYQKKQPRFRFLFYFRRGMRLNDIYAVYDVGLGANNVPKLVDACKIVRLLKDGKVMAESIRQPFSYYRKAGNRPLEDTRYMLSKDNYTALSESDFNQVMMGKVWVGMAARYLKGAVGSPEEMQSMSSSGNSIERWSFKRGSETWHATIKDEKVIDWNRSYFH